MAQLANTSVSITKKIKSFDIGASASNQYNPGDVSSCIKGSVAADDTLTLISSSSAVTGKSGSSRITFGGTALRTTTTKAPLRISSLSPTFGFNYSFDVQQTPTPDLAAAKYYFNADVTFFASTSTVASATFLITNVCSGTCSSGLSSAPIVNVAGEDYRVAGTIAPTCSPCGDGLSTSEPITILFYKVNYTAKSGTVPLKPFIDYAVSKGLLRSSDYFSYVIFTPYNNAGNLTSTLTLKMTD